MQRIDGGKRTLRPDGGGYPRRVLEHPAQRRDEGAAIERIDFGERHTPAWIRVRGDPVPGDIDPAGDPDVVVAADVIEKSGEGGETTRPAGNAAMQSDR